MALVDAAGGDQVVQPRPEIARLVVVVPGKRNDTHSLSPGPGWEALLHQDRLGTEEHAQGWWPEGSVGSGAWDGALAAAAKSARTRDLAAASVQAETPALYPSNEIISGALQVKARIWHFPDGSGEVLVSKSLFSDHEHRSEDTPNQESLAWVPADGPQIPSECPRAAYWFPVVNALGEHLGVTAPRRTCPWLLLDDRLFAELSNARRAASKVRRLARNNTMQYMTTLTLPASSDRSRDRVSSLLRGYLRTREGRRFYRHGYLVTLEPHRNGGYHIHLLHPNRLNAVRVRVSWTRYLTSRGFDLPSGTKWVRTHEKHFRGGARQAARYAGKYVSKSFGPGDTERGLGQHRYLRSDGLSDGERREVYGSMSEALEALVPPHARFFRSSDLAAPSFCEWTWAGWDERGSP